MSSAGRGELTIEQSLEQTGGDVTVLDETVLTALGHLQGKYDAKFVARMISMFMETALVLLIRLKEAVAIGDIAALHHASHELKSCSATIGAYSLATHCERLELMVREGRVADVPSLVGAIDLEYRRVQAALIARLAGPQLVATDRTTRIAAPTFEPGKIQ